MLLATDLTKFLIFLKKILIGPGKCCTIFNFKSIFLITINKDGRAILFKIRYLASAK